MEVDNFRTLRGAVPPSPFLTNKITAATFGLAAIISYRKLSDSLKITVWWEGRGSTMCRNQEIPGSIIGTSLQKLRDLEDFFFKKKCFRCTHAHMCIIRPKNKIRGDCVITLSWEEFSENWGGGNLMCDYFALD